MSEEGKLEIHITDEAGNAVTAEIKLIAIAVYGMENLSQLQLTVDQEVNLLQVVTFADGLTLKKVEVVQDGVRSVISKPETYVPEFPGTVSIILTLAKHDGSTLEVTGGLTIKALDYHAIQIDNIQPVEILPIIGQVEG
ncbi:MAG: hypothetical protein K6D54_02520 [Bacteroidales bacterium]|nr:hypothetical protein [Bacteroidales bacterium]